jgi:hypothetical protein
VILRIDAAVITGRKRQQGGEAKRHRGKCRKLKKFSM